MQKYFLLWEHCSVRPIINRLHGGPAILSQTAIEVTNVHSNSKTEKKLQWMQQRIDQVLIMGVIMMIIDGNQNLCVCVSLSLREQIMMPSIGVDYGGGGGHVPTTIYNFNFVPTTFKNVQTNCDRKNPHILNRNRRV